MSLVTVRAVSELLRVGDLEPAEARLEDSLRLALLDGLLRLLLQPDPVGELEDDRAQVEDHLAVLRLDRLVLALQDRDQLGVRDPVRVRPERLHPGRLERLLGRPRGELANAGGEGRGDGLEVRRQRFFRTLATSTLA